MVIVDHSLSTSPLVPLLRTVRRNQRIWLHTAGTRTTNSMHEAQKRFKLHIQRAKCCQGKKEEIRAVSLIHHFQIRSRPHNDKETMDDVNEETLQNSLLSKSQMAKLSNIFSHIMDSAKTVFQHRHNGPRLMPRLQRPLASQHCSPHLRLPKTSQKHMELYTKHHDGSERKKIQNIKICGFILPSNRFIHGHNSHNSSQKSHTQSDPRSRGRDKDPPQSCNGLPAQRTYHDGTNQHQKREGHLNVDGHRKSHQMEMERNDR